MPPTPRSGCCWPALDREDIRQAEAQVDSASAEVAGAEAELRAAEIDLQRFEALLEANAGSQKQRDDARARVDVARERERGARRSREGCAGSRGSAAVGCPPAKRWRRPRARGVGGRAARGAREDANADAVVVAPVGGIVTQKLSDAGEMVAPRMPILVITDLDHAWANLFVPEPFMSMRVARPGGDVVTDAGDRVPGKVTFISPQAEFTPRNVQTADERSKLVYRIKVPWTTAPAC